MTRKTNKKAKTAKKAKSKSSRCVSTSKTRKKTKKTATRKKSARSSKSTKSRMIKGKKKRKTAKKTSRKRAKKVVDPRVAAAMKQYEEAVLLFNRRSFRKAMSLFEKVANGITGTLAERARVHIAMCEQRIQVENSLRFRTVDDHYNYAVSQINAGSLDDARIHLLKAAKRDSKADHVYYALATVAALSQETEDAIEYLERAIALRAENRFQARNDEDFESLQDDLSFQQLVFPERFPSAPGR